MSLKKKLVLAAATSAVGATMMVGGSFALFTAQATNTGNTFAAGTVKVDASQGKIFAGAQYIGNMAPGDSETGTLTITNSGTLDEWIGLEHTLTGTIFQNYDNSKDSSAGGDYKKDDNPLQISYSIQVKDSTNKAVGDPVKRTAFSTSDTTQMTPFKLLVGQHADITYTYSLPLAAHNDYQDTTGQVNVEVDAVQVRNNSGNNGPTSWNPDINDGSGNN